jgi:hypothetical protein
VLAAAWNVERTFDDIPIAIQQQNLATEGNREPLAIGGESDRSHERRPGPLNDFAEIAFPHCLRAAERKRRQKNEGGRRDHARSNFS